MRSVTHLAHRNKPQGNATPFAQEMDANAPQIVTDEESHAKRTGLFPSLMPLLPVTLYHKSKCNGVQTFQSCRISSAFSSCIFLCCSSNAFCVISRSAYTGVICPLLSSRVAIVFPSCFNSYFIHSPFFPRQHRTNRQPDTMNKNRHRIHTGSCSPLETQ